MKIENLTLDALIPYARNSRTHSDEQVAQVAASIREFGFTNPVLIDADGGIIAGHGRINRSMELGPRYCDVIVRRWQQYTGKRATHAVTGQEFGA